MRILLTNDDGISHPGLAAMLDALEDRAGEFGGPLLDRSAGATIRAPRAAVFPVAPLTVQSATSHGVTFHTPLMVSTETIHEGGKGRPEASGLAVDGRPADCVKLAISRLWPARFGEGSRPDLVVSGINSGANVGINVIYSGTVAAAIEAAFLGVPSIAVSLHIGPGRPLYPVAARYARRVIERLLSEGPLRPHECLSINIPITEADGPMPEVRACPMNTHALVDSYEARESPSRRAYYWASGHGLNFHATDAGTDVAELFQKRITVTPLRYDLTRHEDLARWGRTLAATAAPATP